MSCTMIKQQTYMFKLCRVRTLFVHERGICFNDATRHQTVELLHVSLQSIPVRATYTKKVLFLTKPIEISAAEWQSAEILVDDIE